MLWKNFFCRFGFSAKLHADQGRNFESAVVRDLCKITGITKTHTSPYHPQGNGTTERFNRTLMNMLGTLEPHLKPNWPEYLDTMTHAYNCTQHDSTGYSPYYLMYGRHPRLPVDLVFGLTPSEPPCEYNNYVQRLRDCLKYTYDQANKSSVQAKEQQKKHYDRSAKSRTFVPGDRVLIKVCQVEGRQKLGDRWESQPYVVVKKQPGIPVYVVRAENGQKERVLHQNLLTQCMFFPMGLEQTDEEGESAEEASTSGGVSDGESRARGNGEEYCDTEQREDTREQDNEGGDGKGEPLESITKEQEEDDSSQFLDGPSDPVHVHRNPPRDRHPPKRLTYQLKVVESVQQKIERGRSIWQRARRKISP